jgi:hypothetical protein
MKIAAGVTALGLGGLGGYALASNDGQTAAAGQATVEEPKSGTRTEVVHRTIHVRARGRSEEAALAASSSGPGSAEAPLSDLPSSYEGDDYDDYESESESDELTGDDRDDASDDPWEDEDESEDGDD